MLIKSAIATVLLAGNAMLASANQAEKAVPEPDEITIERALKQPFTPDLSLFEEGDTIGVELAAATERLSSRYRNPPLLELPGHVLDSLHKEVEVPFNMRREAAITQQLACAVSLQVHGVEGIFEAMATPYFSALEEANALNEEAYDSFVFVNAANRGYYSYGHLMMQLIEKKHPGVVTKENAKKALTLAPAANTAQYVAYLSYCARLARDVSRATGVLERLEGLNYASESLDEEIKLAIPTEVAEEAPKS